MSAWFRRFIPVAVVLLGITAAVDISQWPGMVLLAAGIAGAMTLLERIDGTSAQIPDENADFGGAPAE